MARKWIASLLGAAALSQTFAPPALADGWIRNRLRNWCEPPTVQTVPSQPGTIEYPSAPVAPKTDTPMPPAKDVPPAQPMVPQQPAPQIEPQFQPMVSAALGDTSFAAPFAPAMFGDATFTGFAFLPVVITTNPNAPVNTLAVNGRPTPPTNNNGNNNGTTTPTNRVVILQLPQLSYASFKIAENESPRPTDRIFATYSYFNGLPTSAYTSSFDVHRETVGFEKTFLDGRASIGVRVPFLQLSGPDNVFSAFNVRDGQFGDVSVITKYAFYDDRATGNLLSGGLMVTAPTGDTMYTVNGQRIHSTLLQPWGGYIWNLSDSIFVHGFSSIVIPTDSNDVTAWYNDIGLGYWLRKGQSDRFFHGIVPTVEAHVGTPLTNRNGADINQVHIPDYVSLLGGVNFLFWRNSSIGFAAGAPVTGPRPWDFESHVTLNFRF